MGIDKQAKRMAARKEVNVYSSYRHNCGVRFGAPGDVNSTQFIRQEISSHLIYW